MASSPVETDPEQRLRSAEAQVEQPDKQAVRASLQTLVPLVGSISPAFDARVQVVQLWLAREEGQPESAARHVAEAFRHAQACGDPMVMARVQIFAASCSWEVGDNDEALAYLESAWRVVEDAGDPQLAFRCQNILGNVLNNQRQPEASIDCYLRAADIARHAGLPKLQALAEVNAAGPWLHIGNSAQENGLEGDARAAWERAVSANDAALLLAETAQAFSTMAVGAVNRAQALARLGRQAPAEAGFEQALALARQHGGCHVPVFVALGRARMWRTLNDPVAAQRCVEEGLALAEDAQALHAQIMLVELASQVAEDRGDLAAALALHKRFHALHAQQARNRAEQRSRVLAVRLDTARATAEAARERQRAQELTLANAHLVERAEQLSHESTIDPLTGVANRRQLDRALAAAHSEAAAGQPPRCIALLDVDHFKRVNDTYSHAVGDRVLQTLAMLLARQCRDRDLVARFGGEEFVLLFYGIGLARAHAVCERVRLAVQDHDWSQVEPGLEISVSIGVTDMVATGSPSEALARADRLLYQAKSGGRNRVITG